MSDAVRRSAELTDQVVASFDETPDERLRAVLAALTRHLHAFVAEVGLTPTEWAAAIDYLTAVGQACTPTRQEFVLLSDVLGVSSLVEAIATAPDGTEATVLGPFHLTESPRRELGADIDLLGEGRPCRVGGTVRDTRGRPIPGATVDVWQCTADGYYDVQQPETQPAGNGRGLFVTDGEGRYWFRTVVPSHYPIPTDGPVGWLLDATRRHPYRPAHVHFLVRAPGFRSVTTHAFVAGSPYLDGPDGDAVFAVKPSLVVDFSGPDGARFDVVLGDEVSASR